MLEGMRTGIRSTIDKLLGATSVDENVIRDFTKNIQRALLQGDVNVKLVLDLSSKIQDRALNEKPPPGLPRKDHVVKILYDELTIFLGKDTEFQLPLDKSNVILLIGIQGSGKTTVAGKLSRFFLKKGKSVGIVAADTFRPGALTQLRMSCSNINVEVYGNEDEKDPVNLAKYGVKYFTEQDKNVIIIDTAGRHKNEKSLLEEIETISSKIDPSLTLLVIDGTIGQQCYSQSESFHKSVPVGGIIITKLDGSAKGGGALAAAAATGSRVMFLGTGERIDDLEAFSSTRFVGRLLGMGDINTLLERAKELEVQGDEKQMKRMMSGKATINDLYNQLEQVGKMGSLSKLMDMIPGLSSAVPSSNLEEMDEKMKVWRIIINSMTRLEKEDPDILNSSRIKRIARGSGNSEKDVKEMMTKFRQTKQVMKASKGREFRQLLQRLSVS